MFFLKFYFYEDTCQTFLLLLYDHSMLFLFFYIQCDFSNKYLIIDDQKYIDSYKRFLGETISRYGSIHRHILVDCRATTIHHIDAALRLYCNRDYHFTHDGSGVDIRKVYNQENLISYMTKDIDRPNLPNLNIERDKVIDSVNSDIGKNHYSVSGLDAREYLENLYKSDGTR